jgi:hypothetical protein
MINFLNDVKSGKYDDLIEIIKYDVQPDFNSYLVKEIQASSNLTLREAWMILRLAKGVVTKDQCNQNDL